MRAPVLTLALFAGFLATDTRVLRLPEDLCTAVSIGDDLAVVRTDAMRRLLTIRETQDDTGFLAFASIGPLGGGFCFVGARDDRITKVDFFLD